MVEVPMVSVVSDDSHVNDLNDSGGIDLVVPIKLSLDVQLLFRPTSTAWVEFHQLVAHQHGQIKKRADYTPADQCSPNLSAQTSRNRCQFGHVSL